jgi:nitrate reductase delta subunit
MPIHQVLSTLLCYPEQEWLDSLEEANLALVEWPQARTCWRRCSTSCAAAR